MIGQTGKQIDVVAGLILRKQRLLACQRHESSVFPLKWEFPGGKVEVGESYLDALKRELREELGIEVQEAKEIFGHNHLYPGAAEARLKFFLINHYRGEIRNLVFKQISWVQVADLSQLDFLEGDLPLIHKLVSSKGPALLF
jgi:8-oxo-dGTP diphosphatase